MSIDNVLDDLSEIRSKVEFISWFESDRGELAQYGFYMFAMTISEDIDSLSKELKMLRDARSNDISK